MSVRESENTINNLDDQDHEANAKLENLQHHIESVNQARINQQWDDIDFHIKQIYVLAEEIGGSQSRFTIDLYRTTEIMCSVQKQEYMGEFDSEHSEPNLTEAADQLAKAKELLINLSRDYPQQEYSPYLKEQNIVLKLVINHIDQKIAEHHRNNREVKRLEDLSKTLWKEYWDILPNEDPLRNFIEAKSLFTQIRQPLIEGRDAIIELDLETANRIFTEAKPKIVKMEAILKNIENNNLIDKAKGTIKMLTLIFTALQSYSDVLNSAILRNVNKDHIKMLVNAEKELHESKKLINEYGPQVFNYDEDFLQSLTSFVDAQTRATKNLKHMCRNSLKLKEIGRAAFPRLIIYFLVLFLVLLFALPLSGLVSELDSFNLGFITLISFAVSMIAVFGFESTRLIPWLDAIANFFATIFQRNSRNDKAKDSL